MPLSKIYGAIPGLEEYAKVVEKMDKTLSGDRTPNAVDCEPKAEARDVTPEAVPEPKLTTKGWLN
jgi:hypothetical protein